MNKEQVLKDLVKQLDDSFTAFNEFKESVSGILDKLSALENEVNQCKAEIKDRALNDEIIPLSKIFVIKNSQRRQISLDRLKQFLGEGLESYYDKKPTVVFSLKKNEQTEVTL